MSKIPRLSKLALCLLLALALALVACGKDGGAAAGGDKAASGEKTAAAAPVKATDADRAEAKKLWDTLCSTCHGKTGAGDGPNAATLNPKPRSLNDAEWQKSADDAKIRKVIVEGGPAVGLNALMPPNPDLKGKPGVTEALVEMVRALNK